LTDGWLKPREKRVRKMHYFKDGRSLCEGYHDFESEGQEDDWHTEEHCAVCEEELCKLRKREIKDKNRCSHIDVVSGMAVRCGEEVYDSGLCRKHWVTTSQEFYGGWDMTGAEKENFDESED